MWDGEYNFFDYKYNINGYEGQDYMSPVQYIMTAIGVLAIILLLIFLRKTKKEKSKKFLFVLGIVMTSLYIIKTTWESYWDIKTGRGFNLYILPFDTCSIFMPALIIAGVSKKDSLLEDFSSTFLSTIGFAGGVANFIFLRGLNYYPMFTFGALYSYFWHVLMVFVALYIPVTGFHKFKFIDILKGMVFLLAFAVVVIPLNYIKDFDFMLLNGAGGVPLIEDLASKLISNNLRPLATILMLFAYLGIDAVLVSICIGIGELAKIFKR